MMDECGFMCFSGVGVFLISVCISGTRFFFFFAKALCIVFSLYEKCFQNKVRFSLFDLLMDWWKDGGEEVAAGWEELQIEGM